MALGAVQLHNLKLSKGAAPKAIPAWNAPVPKMKDGVKAMLHLMNSADSSFKTASFRTNLGASFRKAGISMSVSKSSDAALFWPVYQPENLIGSVRFCEAIISVRGPSNLKTFALSDSMKGCGGSDFCVGADLVEYVQRNSSIDSDAEEEYDDDEVAVAAEEAKAHDDAYGDNGDDSDADESRYRTFCFLFCCRLLFIWQIVSMHR
jgi:hypothetical protein